MRVWFSKVAFVEIILLIWFGMKHEWIFVFYSEPMLAYSRHYLIWVLCFNVSLHGFLQFYFTHWFNQKFVNKVSLFQWTFIIVYIITIITLLIQYDVMTSCPHHSTTISCSSLRYINFDPTKRLSNTHLCLYHFNKLNK